MRARTPIVLLLLIAMSLTAPARTLARTEDEPMPEQDLSIAPYEEYEAREIAAVFKKQLEKENDIAPLIDKYFVSDFDKRFAGEAATTFWFPAKPSALAQADQTDARRYYVALTNLQFLMIRLAMVVEKQHKAQVRESATEKEEDEDIAPEKLFPTDVIEAFKSNPHLAELIEDNDGAMPAPTGTTEAVAAESVTTSDESADKTSGEDKHTLKTVYELRDLSTAMENVAARIRTYLNSLPAEQTALDSLMPLEDEDDPTTAPPSYRVSESAYITGEDENFYGMPGGTRLICASVFNLHMDFIRVEGKLKILAVYMPMRD